MLGSMADATCQRDVSAGEVIAAQDDIATEVRKCDKPGSLRTYHRKRTPALVRRYTVSYIRTKHNPFIFHHDNSALTYVPPKRDTSTRPTVYRPLRNSKTPIIHISSPQARSVLRYELHFSVSHWLGGGHLNPLQPRSYI